MRFISNEIPGCYEIVPDVRRDARGLFVKTFHQEMFAEHGLETDFAESYYSLSHKNVLRGLHFQVPPQHHAKLVYCTTGEVIDAVVDLRVGSPSYGGFKTFRLSAGKANLLYVPAGLAHGFCVLSDTALMVYHVGTVYSPEHDAGILWSSAGIPWPCEEPILSERDSGFPPLSDFASPFVFEGTP